MRRSWLLQVSKPGERRPMPDTSIAACAAWHGSSLPYRPQARRTLSSGPITRAAAAARPSGVLTTDSIGNLPSGLPAQLPLNMCNFNSIRQERQPATPFGHL